MPAQHGRPIRIAAGREPPLPHVGQIFAQHDRGPAQAVQRRVESALNVVGLEHKAEAYPDELSGGEQQRVGIARAIVNGPPVLLADEPTGNLDPATSLEIVQLLERISQRGTTVLISSHDQAIVNAMRKRVITIRQGEIASDVDSGVYEIEAIDK